MPTSYLKRLLLQAYNQTHDARVVAHELSRDKVLPPSVVTALDRALNDITSVQYAILNQEVAESDGQRKPPHKKESGREKPFDPSKRETRV